MCIYICGSGVWGWDRFVFFKQKTAYEMRISDWSSDVCSSDLFPTKRELSREIFVLGNGRQIQRLHARENILDGSKGSTVCQSRKGGSVGQFADRKSVV